MTPSAPTATARQTSIPPSSLRGCSIPTATQATAGHAKKRTHFSQRRSR